MKLNVGPLSQANLRWCSLFIIVLAIAFTVIGLLWLELHQQAWQIKLNASNDSIQHEHYRLLAVLLLMAGLLSVVTVFALYMMISIRKKTSRIEDERNKVKHLLKNLPGMAYQSLNKALWPSIFVSEGCEALSGYSKQAFEQHNIHWGSIIHPDDYERVVQTVNTAIENKQLFELEYRIITKHNGIRLVWERGEALSSLISNKITLEGFVSDITNVKQAEIALLRSHSFSDAIVDSVVEAVITIDSKGKIQSFNRAAEKMFGYALDEVKNIDVKTLMPQAFAQQHSQYLTDYMRTNKAHILGIGRELEAKRKDGTIFPVHISVNEILYHEDRMFVGLIRDISGQRLAQDQARKFIEQMAHAERLNSLGEMAAGIAHEVNQPLTAISLFAQSGKTLCNNGNFTRLPEIFEKLSTHAHRAGAVLERMQMMTKQGIRQKEPVDCSTLINEVVQLAEADARMRAISIQVNHCEQPVAVYIDRVQIQQVLLNLIRNGMEAMQLVHLVNGNVIQINTQLILSPRPSERNIIISVVDSGSGLDSSMENKLFTAFASTKEQGMGIGLSISKSIIEEHGGNIHFSNNDVAGSEFSFTLPIVE